MYADTFLSDGERHQPVSARESAELLVDLGVRVLAPGIVPVPSPDAQQRQMDELAEFFEMARGLGAEVTITLANVGRRDFRSMVEVSNAAIRLGARRLDLMDSTSSLAPEAMKVFIRRYRSQLIQPVPVTMHVHDDFGLATAGAIAAATAGASPDVSISGMSYPPGSPPITGGPGGPRVGGGDPAAQAAGRSVRLPAPHAGRRPSVPPARRGRVSAGLGVA